jgi:paraquat-inducible protein B
MAQVTSAVERLAAQIEKAEIAKVVDNINTLVVDTNKAINQLQVDKINEQILALATSLQASTKQIEKVLSNPALNQGITDLGIAAAGIKDVVASSQDDVKATLKDLPKITARLSSTAEEIDKIVKSDEIKRTLAGLAGTADNAGPTMIALQKTALRLNNLLSSQQRDIETIILGLRKTVANISALSADAGENPSRIIFGNPPPKTNPGDNK